MKSPFHSIRWRVQAWHGIILLLAIVAFCLTILHLNHDEQIRKIDIRLRETMGRVLFRSLIRTPEFEAENPEELPNENYFDKGRGSRQSRIPPQKLAELLRKGKLKVSDQINVLFEGEDTGHLYFIIYDNWEKRILLKSENVSEKIDLTSIKDTKTKGQDDLEEIRRTKDNCRELIAFSHEGLVFIVGKEISAEMQEIRTFAWTISACGFGFWLLGLIGGWWIAGRAIRPIENISRTATRIAQGNLSERIDITGTDDELNQLSQVLNQTFDEVHSAFERQRQFTADASHELRTPITILLSETQRALKRERSAEEYCEVLETCQATAQRMRRLVEALLMLARQEKNAAGGEQRDCDLAEILNDAKKQIELIVDEQGIQMHSDLQSAPCHADATALSILANNLITNAIEHHRSNGEKNVFLSSGYNKENKYAYMRIEDNGPGIPEEDLPHIFERFYRADKVRTGNNPHTGLGLAIVKSIADNHYAEIIVANRPSGGCCVEVRFKS